MDYGTFFYDSFQWQFFPRGEIHLSRNKMIHQNPLEPKRTKNNQQDPRKNVEKHSFFRKGKFVSQRPIFAWLNDFALVSGMLSMCDQLLSFIDAGVKVCMLSPKYSTGLDK